MWDSLFFVLPLLLLLLLLLGAVFLPGGRRRALARRGALSLGLGLWRAACRVLELPLPIPPGAGEPEVQLVCKPTALASYLTRHCAALRRPAPAAWPRGDPHLQVLSSLAWPVADGVQTQGGADGVCFARDHLLLPDKGIVALDWAVRLGEDRGVAGKPPQHRVRVPGSPPILLLIPNALGKLTPHLGGLCSLALRQGFYPAVFRRRGLGGCPLATPRYQEFGDPADLAQAVAYLRSRYPSSALVGASEGSGSGLLLSYLGERGSSSYLSAAACISPVLHGRLWMESALPPLYHWGALLYRKLQISRYATALRSVMDVRQILRSRSLRETEELMFCSPPEGGAEEQSGGAQGEPAPPKPDWAGYWARNEPLRDADDVAVPVLCLRSRDDPLLPPPSTLPMSLFQNSPYFLLALTQRGGHCGFLAERETERDAPCWSHAVVLEYFRVVAEFLREEAWRTQMGGVAQPVGGVRVRHRSGPVLRPRPRGGVGGGIRRGTAPLPWQPPTGSSMEEEEEEETFTWSRSYTR